MRQVIYAMQFAGQAVPSGEPSGVIKVSSSSPSCSIATIVGPEGVTGRVQPAAGGSAAFESEVTMVDESHFREAGSITFGEGGHRLRFSTIGQGYNGPSADPALLQGAVMWQIDGGDGQFEGANGVITSNFTVTESGEVMDYQLGVILLP